MLCGRYRVVTPLVPRVGARAMLRAAPGLLRETLAACRDQVRPPERPERRPRIPERPDRRPRIRIFSRPCRD